MFNIDNYDVFYLYLFIDRFMIKVTTLLLLLTCYMISLANCRIGALLEQDYQTATLECFASEGIANIIFVIKLSPYQTYERLN